MRSQPPQTTFRIWLRPALLLAALFAVALAIRILGRHAAMPLLPAETAAAPGPVLTREFPVFGSYARFSFYGDAAKATAAADRIAAELQALHDTINIFDPQSELSRLNAAAAAAPVTCGECLWDILQAGRRAYRLSDGLFDISVGPLMRLWGFHRKRQELPAAADISAARTLVGLDKVIFNDADRSVSFPQAGMYLDLGGIAKGYALDMAAGLARDCGADSGLLDLGGNVLALPRPPPGRTAYTVGIRNPLAPESVLGTVPIHAAAIASSGGYERFVEIQGRRLGHIIDPRTGEPAIGCAGVSVMTPLGVDSDVFSTTVFVGGAALAARLAETVPGTGILIVTGDPKSGPRLAEFGAWRWQDAPTK